MGCLGEGRILAWLGGSLDAESQVEADLHISSCEECTTLIALLAQSETTRPNRDVLDTAGRYKIQGDIGMGGMGRVIAARDTLLGRDVAIKVAHNPDSPRLLARLKREMSITATLQHPSIVPIYDAGMSIDGDPFFVMRRIPGESFDQALRLCPDLPSRLLLLPALTSAVEALAYAHEEGILHRDLKPQNIMIGPYGECIVVDWGLALRLDDCRLQGAVATADPDTIAEVDDPDTIAEASEELEAPDASPALTKQGQVLGSLAYMPSEQSLGGKPKRQWDLHGLGGTLYQLFTGVAPHLGADGKRCETIVDVSTLVPGLPSELAAIIRRSLSSEKREQYTSASELAEDLRGFQAGRLVAAYQYSSRELIKRWLGKHRGAVFVAMAMSLLLLGGTVFSFQRILAGKEVAVRERKFAEVERAGAEKLVEFSLTNLRSKLEALGRLDILEGVAKEIERYYRAMPLRAGAQGGTVLARQSLAYGLLGEVQLALGSTSEAKRYYEISAHHAQKSLEQKASSEGANALCRAHLHQGDLALSLKDYATADTELALCSAIADAHMHEGVQWSDLKAHSLLNIARSAREQSKEQVFLDAIKAAASHASKSAESSRVLPISTRRILYRVYEELGRHYEEEGEAVKAAEQYELGLALVQSMNVDKEDAEYKAQLSLAYGAASRGRYITAEMTEAAEANANAIEYSALLTSQDPRNSDWQRLHASNVDLKGHIAFELDQLPQALAAFEEGVEQARRLSSLEPQSPALLQDLAAAEFNLGSLYLQQEKPTLADEHYYRCLDAYLLLLKKRPTSKVLRSEIAVVYRSLSQLEEMQKHFSLSSEHAQSAMAMTKELYDQTPNVSNTLGLVGGMVAVSLASEDITLLKRARALLELFASKAATNKDIQFAFTELKLAEAELSTKKTSHK